MFCSIENAPLFGRNYEGNFMLIYPATGRQFTIEVIIVFVLCKFYFEGTWTGNAKYICHFITF